MVARGCGGDCGAWLTRYNFAFHANIFSHTLMLVTASFLKSSRFAIGRRALQQRLYYRSVVALVAAALARLVSFTAFRFSYARRRSMILGLPDSAASLPRARH